MAVPVIYARSGHPAPVDVASEQRRTSVDSQILEESSILIPHHQLAVKPAGNQYTASSNARHAMGNFQSIPDELVAIVLEYLESAQLRLLGSTCKALYAFSRSDDLWKSLFIR